jgi:glycolate oxidase iron-sulfur subunit
MLASTAPGNFPSGEGNEASDKRVGASNDVSPTRLRVGMLVGCVQEGLYGRINEATERVLEANGFEVVEVTRQECCGALHAHAGALEGARQLARTNVTRFEAADVDRIAVNAAGCGATMKEYGHLLSADPDFAERASRLAGSVRDVLELLAEVGPREGAPVPCTVAYDHPCHLIHAQGIEAAPLEVLAAVPEAEVRVVEGASECCGGAGIYGLTHPDLGGRIGRDKVQAVRDVGGDLVATPNPGCMMQIGAGLRLGGAPEGVVHPVELLDESYRRAGYYL